MTPIIDGQVHTFVEHGLYNGLFLMRDDESQTFWDHLTGEAVYGPRVGTTLEVGNLLHTKVAQVLESDPDAQIALSDRNMRSDEDMELGGLLARAGRRLSRMFGSTVAEEDDRRPTMDLGIGVWEGDEARYYAYELVTAEGNVVMDTFQGRRIAVFLDPSAYVLSSFFVDADKAEWDDRVLRFSNGQYIEGGVLHDSNGERTDAARPLQIFTRWYGFALTFPSTTIYGEER